MGTIEPPRFAEYLHAPHFREEVRTTYHLRRIEPTWRQWLTGALAEYVIERRTEFSWQVFSEKEQHDEH